MIAFCFRNVVRCLRGKWRVLLGSLEHGRVEWMIHLIDFGTALELGWVPLEDCMP